MPRNLLIKVCGMRDPENIRELSNLNPDFIGHIFYPESPRYAGADAVNLKALKFPSSIIRVGVFVNEPLHLIREISNFFNLGMLQLHGDESPSVCESLYQEGFKIIKAFRLNNQFDFSIVDRYAPFCKMFLFDTGSEKFGGSGKKFNWEILNSYAGSTRYLLSGGIGPGDASEIRNLNHPQLAGVDLNSRFEKEPGLKDISLLRAFMNELKQDT